MANDSDSKSQNHLTLDGFVYKTSGNILFDDCEDSPFHLAQSALLEKIDCFLEHGMQTLLKKIKN